MVASESRHLPLFAAVRELALARTLDAVAATVRATARQLTGADGATFVLRVGDDCHYVAEDAIAPLWIGQQFPMSDCISGWVMREKQAAAIPDVYDDPRIPPDAYRPTFVRSLLMVPVHRDDPLAAIGLYWADRHLATAHE